MVQTARLPASLLSECGDAFLEAGDILCIIAGCGERDRQKRVGTPVDRGQMVAYEMDDGGLVASRME